MRGASSRELQPPSPDQHIGFLEGGEDSPIQELIPRPALGVLAGSPGLQPAMRRACMRLPQMAEIDTPQSLDAAGGQ